MSAAGPSAQALAVLRRRAEALARPLEPRQRHQEAKLVVVRLGGARYGFDAAHVVEVLAPARVTSVPGTPGWVKGVIQHRGRILAVIDLEALLGWGSGTADAPSRVVVVSAGGMTFAVAADPAVEVAAVDAGALVPVAPGPEGEPPALVDRLTSSMVGVVDLEALVKSRRLVVDDRDA